LLQQQAVGNDVGRRGPYLAPRMEPQFPLGAPSDGD